MILKRSVKDIKKKYNIQKGKIIYSDLNKPGKPFFSKRYKIVGKPDYIINEKNRYIPVEIKTGHHLYPQKNHIIQLASYCQLLEENYGDFVPYGILIYENIHKFKIPFDPKMRYEFEAHLKDMRKMINRRKILRNHNNPRKCKNCSMRSYCSNKLL
jgi:CRISPR-associated exonuclease Cas4